MNDIIKLPYACPLNDTQRNFLFYVNSDYYIMKLSIAPVPDKAPDRDCSCNPTSNVLRTLPIKQIFTYTLINSLREQVFTPSVSLQPVSTALFAC
jgi:hypothetical protein